MNMIQNFAFEEHLVRVVSDEDAPWFVAADVAKVLNFRDAANALRSVPDEEKGTRKVSTLGGDQSLLCVSEPGLYRLIFRSNKPEAERFQHFVFHEVLPQIRRTGRFDPALSRPPAPEPFEIDVQHAPLSAKVEYLRMVSRLRGREAAVAMMPHIGLPDIDLILLGTRVSVDGGADCLTHLLNWRDDLGSTVRDLINAVDEGWDIQQRLMRLGVRAVITGEPGILVATNTKPVRAIFAGTKWENGAHVAALRGLDGVTSANPVKFEGYSSRTLFIPAAQLSRNRAAG